MRSSADPSGSAIFFASDSPFSDRQFLGMQVGSATSQVLAAVQAADSTEAAKTQFNTTLLKKTLDSQKDQVAQLMASMTGKGQVLDIRA